MIKLGKKVAEALKNNIPVVALESTIISHGMPYPLNVETALKVEREIETFGAVPATIGIIDGMPIIGMTKEEITAFGQKKGIYKVSRRDLPIIYARKAWGATTVAATMILAKEAGIEVFVTGGIGGVHRHGEVTFDISADLQELAKTDVTVVCAGAKAILDIPLTLEYLETYGVPVLPYKTKEFPCFYNSHSGIYLEHQVDSPQEIALIIFEKRKAKLKGGLVIANPINESAELPLEVMNRTINQALEEMERQGVHGKESTPFLLKRVTELTGGDSLSSNINLVLNNARLGAKIACELAKIKEVSK